MPLMTRETFLSSRDRAYKDVPVPEMGEEAVVRISVMSGTSRDEWETKLAQRQGPNGKLVDLKGLKAHLVVATAVDEEGDSLFTLEDLEAINEHNGTVIDRLSDIALLLNGLTEEALEEMGKN